MKIDLTTSGTGRKSGGVLRAEVLGVLALCFGWFQCQTPDAGKKEPVRDMARQEQLAAIQKTYTPIECFHATFRIAVKKRGGSQEANGSLRVDNVKSRMLFGFTDTLFGITLSRVLIKDGVAHVYNPHASGEVQRQSIPVDRFAVSGLGSNSIVLPFRLFQDLLYARIPPDVFAPRADLRKVGLGKIIVSLDSENETYRYGFTENRLRELDYVRKSTGDAVKVALEGTYGESAFPQSIRMNMIPKKGQEQGMGIRFRDLNVKARCGDEYFPDL